MLFPFLRFVPLCYHVVFNIHLLCGSVQHVSHHLRGHSCRWKKEIPWIGVHWWKLWPRICRRLCQSKGPLYWSKLNMTSSFRHPVVWYLAASLKIFDIFFRQWNVWQNVHLIPWKWRRYWGLLPWLLWRMLCIWFHLGPLVDALRSWIILDGRVDPSIRRRSPPVAFGT